MPALGPVELPVHLLVGNPDNAEAVPLGTVHLALRADTDGEVLDQANARLCVRLVPVDPGDLRTQLADLLDAHTAALRLPEGSTGAAPPH